MSSSLATLPVATRAAAAQAHAPLVLSAAMLAGGVALSLTAADRVEVEDVVDGAMLMLFPALGGLLLLRGRVLRIARLFQAAGIATGAGFLAGGAAEHDWTGRSFSGVLATVGFTATIFLLLAITPFFFPNGKLPSRRWRPVLAVSVVAAVTSCLTVLLMPGAVDEDSTELGANPIGVGALEPVLDILEPASFVVFAACALLGIVSMLLRLRRADRRTRRQIGILTAGVAVLVGLFLLDSTLQSLGGATYGVVAAIVAIGAVPVAAGIALLRD